jgi:potassium channel subfamily K
MVITFIILVFLTFNLAFLRGQSKEGIFTALLLVSKLTTETRRLHHVQREFMMQTLSFFFFLGIVALIFSKIETLSYVGGIYFLIVTTLTIGFGDIVPHTTVVRVLIFPVTVVGIALLALIVKSIVRLLSDRARRRRLALKKRLKAIVAEKERSHPGYASKLRQWAKRPSEPAVLPKLERTLSLQEELIKLRTSDWERERRANLRNMAICFAVFLVFWFIGAMIFHLVEVLQSILL